MLKCAQCDKVYKYESERKRHQKSHFPQFECKICSKKFSFLSALRRHQKQHERTGSVQCPECGGNFRDDTLLKRHIQYAHRGTHCCSECNATFSSDLALRTHSKIHKPESERRFRCMNEGCTKTFNFPHHLQRHELTHTNAKQHYCNVCGKGFIQSHHLKTHFRTHNPENRLFCTVTHCKKKFISKYAWKKHIGIHGKLLEKKQTDAVFSPTEIRCDSGISSDSNSAFEFHKIGDKNNSEDNVLCATCGTLILQHQYVNHRLNCMGSLNEHFKSEDLDQQLSKNNREEVSLNSLNNSNKLVKNTCELNTKIKGNATRIYNGSVMYSELSELKDTTILAVKIGMSTNKFDTNNNGRGSNLCDGCACAKNESLCGSQRSNKILPSTIKAQNACNINKMPEIEYRKDGIVKIRETFDTDIITVKETIREKSKVKTEVNDLKFVPFNSCKAVLGNCIVSEDGSMGEGCLCAKMIVDEQQMSAQEIDELTPNPNAVWIS